ncbi:hypothetical protein [Neptunicella sp. SCSIO 80796]|uniref:hypothetical protein n=1 Tax=Neptunicella plasticusilytica TaxID=3117012 RepID=UPI003A4DFF13
MKKVIFATGLFLAAATAFAVTDKLDPQLVAKKAESIEKVDVIAKLDQDKDGKLTIKEAMSDPVLLASFGKIDTDGDGQISQSEMEAAKLTEQEQGS